MVNLFVNHAVLGALSQPQAQMIDRPGLSYGLFHLHAQPIKLYGTLTTRVDFKGLNMDIGHLRSLRWSQANDPAAWIAYNRMRGQQASALEHATPEQFWVDRKQCRYTDANGQTVNPTLADCPQAVSAVKAIAIAASQGQKIYTITQKNAATALPQLTVSRTVAAEIKNAVAVGKEVTVHEKAINAHEFSGVGYIIVDPDTGAGAYLIEGGGSGGWIAGFIQGVSFVLFAAIVTFIASIASGAVWVIWVVLALLALANILAAIDAYKALKPDKDALNCYLGGLGVGLSIGGLVPIRTLVSRVITAIGLAISVLTDATTNSKACGL